MENENKLIRLNKYLTSIGYCSRREADRYIADGRLTVNGSVACIGDKISENDEVLLDNKSIKKETDRVYIALNKPVGITCTTDQNIEGNIVDFINFDKRIFHIGRLDKPSEGLILLTNDGEIVNKILRASNDHEKEYLVRVDKEVTDDFIQKMSNGIQILDTVTNKCSVIKISDYAFKITLTQGLNRQIRRMCDQLEYQVYKLKRLRIMNIELGNLKKGDWRYLTEEEMKGLNALTENSKKDI